MDKDLRLKLETMQADFTQVTGRPFAHFYCPIAFKDEDIELCKAHIVNEAFRNSAGTWTVQRKDIDNFYGSNFEADFTILSDVEGGIPRDIFTNKTLAKRLRPKIILDGQPVDHFFPKRAGGTKLSIGLKMSPEDFMAGADDGKKRLGRVVVSKDVRVPGLVALIKAAHLTLFELLGYRYALSRGGRFAGREILGEFFLRNRNKPKADVLANAYPFFREYAPMYRPFSDDPGFQGTSSDGLLLACRGSGASPWALGVIVKTSQKLHCVMIPVLDDLESVTKFSDFLGDQESQDEHIEASLYRIKDGQWLKEPREPITLVWPKKGVLYP